jgi:hypothetical protein
MGRAKVPRLWVSRHMLEINAAIRTFSCMSPLTNTRLD